MESAKKICLNCGKELSEKALFCDQCGTKVVIPEKPQKRFCSNCGEELGAEALFCEHCGVKIEQDLEEDEADLFFDAHAGQGENLDALIASYIEEEHESDPIEIEEVQEEEKIVESEGYVLELKKFVSSPLFLILAIATTFTGLMQWFALDFINAITYIFLSAGTWVLWANAKKEEITPLSGVNKIKKGVKFNLVMTIIGLSLIALVLVIAIFGLLFEGALGAALGILLGGGFMLSFLAVVVGLFFKSILGFINGLMTSIKANQELAASKVIFAVVMILLVTSTIFISVTASTFASEMIMDLIGDTISMVGVPMDITLSGGIGSLFASFCNSAVACYGVVLMIIYKFKFSKKQ